MSGVILWEGRSRINGAPVVAIATGFGAIKSKNIKTGDMVQTWVLYADMAPGPAARAGLDEAVCGSCPLRPVGGTGACYVNMWAPSRVWQAWKDGRYSRITARERREIIESRHVRFGSYGDPVAVNPRVWRALVPGERGRVTGYTHQWRLASAQAYRDFLMASVETTAERRQAQALGWRVFQVIPLNERMPEGLTWCPSDKLNPKGPVECKNCGLCSGTEGFGKSSIGIYAHGASAATFGSKKKQRAGPFKKRPQEDVVFVRVPRDIHSGAKKAAARNGLTLKAFVRDAINRRMKSLARKSRR